MRFNFLLLCCCILVQLQAQPTYRDTLISNKHGMADASGKIFIPALYDEITPYAYSAFDFSTGNLLSSGETVFVVRSGKKFGIIDQQGKNLATCIYSEVVVDYCNGGTYRIMAVKKKGKYAFLSPAGTFITGFDFVAIDTGDFADVPEVIAYVRKKGSKKWELLDKRGKLVTEAPAAID
jgi:hypothetical protein